MKKYIQKTIALAGLSLVLLTGNLFAIEDAVKAANEIEDRAERWLAMANLAVTHEEALLTKLNAGEPLSQREIALLRWRYIAPDVANYDPTQGSKDHIQSWDYALLTQLFEANFRMGEGTGIQIDYLIHPNTPYEEVMELAHGLIPRIGHIVRHHRSWSNNTQRDAFYEAVMTGRIASGQLNPHYRTWFNARVKAMPAENALPVLEAEIRSLLAVPESDTRNAWIKNLRAQHVILQTFVP